MAQEDIALMAHLLRRAGFGATRAELDDYVAKGYEATVEKLLHPENAPPYEDDDIVMRYHVDEDSLQNLNSAQSYWLRRMINTKRPLEEKIALFWHGLLATGYTKTNQPKNHLNQIDMFRRNGLGNFRTLLIQISRDPTMIFYLDNKDSHKDAVNENYGRELLELFSMGVGMDGHPNYTEQDVKECARAFTGWTIPNADFHAIRAAQNSFFPYGGTDWQFEYMADDHDDTGKTFLGHTGPFNGEDIIEIICRQPATARFISRHLYNFFVADEPQVPAWQHTPPRDSEAIGALENAYFQSQYDIRSVLRVLFNSDFFKEATFAKVKSPTELVVGTVRLTGGPELPEVDDVMLSYETNYMGQQLLDPPSVEGWHTGKEWITTGSLVNRINFAVGQFADPNKSGTRDVINKVMARGTNLPAEELVDTCLDLIGPITVSETAKQQLIAHAKAAGGIRPGSKDQSPSDTDRVREMLQLIVSTREYQFA